MRVSQKGRVETQGGYGKKEEVWNSRELLTGGREMQQMQ